MNAKIQQFKQYVKDHKVEIGVGAVCVAGVGITLFACHKYAKINEAKLIENTNKLFALLEEKDPTWCAVQYPTKELRDIFASWFYQGTKVNGGFVSDLYESKDAAIKAFEEAVKALPEGEIHYMVEAVATA